ncbi:MAG: RNA pyrophosphohydrolase [Erythrobacter sp.]
MSDLPYRPCAGFMLANTDGHILVGQRIDRKDTKSTEILRAWQMPQGGIDKGEDEERAALRELEEETGIAAHLVTVITRTSSPLRYDLPPELVGKAWKGKYRGQEQHWFLGRFHGNDADIDLNAHEPAEFEAYRWVQPIELPDLIVPFKRNVYERLLKEFSEFL